MSNVA